MDKSRKRLEITEEVAQEQEQQAGEFSAWLRHTRHAQRLGTVGSDVPCGTCNACCRSSYFIHIRPDEKQTLARIPRALLFPAPGLPAGNVLMGYDEQGRCPMLIDDRCSIYAHRPQTCRDFDCRVFAATGITLEGNEAQAMIAERVRHWRFDFPSETDRKEYSAVRAAAAFLQEREEWFPPGMLPQNPVQLAVLAIRVYDVFSELNETSAATGERPPDAEVAKAVMAAMQQLETAPSKPEPAKPKAKRKARPSR
jgi:Fe-S-cluster containining protein